MKPLAGALPPRRTTERRQYAGRDHDLGASQRLDEGGGRPLAEAPRTARLGAACARARRRVGRGQFYIPELVVHELGVRPIPDRLADALGTAARAYMTRSAADPASAGTSDEATIFALSAGAVRLWSLLQDAVEDMSCPSVVSTALDRKDNLVKHWTNAGRERERAKIERWRAEEDRVTPTHRGRVGHRAN